MSNPAQRRLSSLRGRLLEDATKTPPSTLKEFKAPMEQLWPGSLPHKPWSPFQKCTRTFVDNPPKGMWDSPGSAEGRFQTRTGAGHSCSAEAKQSSRLDHISVQVSGRS